jgi:hypothetical protein
MYHGLLKADKALPKLGLDKVIEELKTKVQNLAIFHRNFVKIDDLYSSEIEKNAK